MIKIAIYGKGGIGKSTTTANLAVALTESGKRVMQIGCDPKADSTCLLIGGEPANTVLDVIRSGEDATLETIVTVGTAGVYCVEAGGPTPGIGCAGRGIITAFEKLDELDAYETYKPDVILFDVLGDVVCGGFAMPLRKDYADAVFVVTSGEKMALYAAANIMLALKNFKSRGYARLGGLILNSRNVANEERLVAELADEESTCIAGIVPREPLIQQAEAAGKTLMEAFPKSAAADVYRALAQRMLNICGEA